MRSTREAAESPVMRCLREGQVLGLAEHTVLVNRRGTGNRHPGLGRADPRPGRQSDRCRHGVSRRQQGAPAASRAALPGQPRCADRPHQPSGIRESADRRGRERAPGRASAPRAALPRSRSIQARQRHLRPSRRAISCSSRSPVCCSRGCAPATRSARLGGDEFGILLQNCALDQALRDRGDAAPGDPRLPVHLAGRRARRSA